MSSEKSDVCKVEQPHSVVNSQGQLKIHGFVTERQHHVSQDSLPLTNVSGKKKHRKGGLSMFLTGALDKAPPMKVPADAPIIPKVEGPAWGGVQRSKDLSSLLEIQSQQTEEPGSSLSNVLVEQFPQSPMPLKVIKGKQAAGGSIKGSKKHSESHEVVLDGNNDAGTSRISLKQFIHTSPPIAVTPNKAIKVIASGSNGNSPTPWAGSSNSPTPWMGSNNSSTPWAGSSSPLTSAYSFRDIQVEQVNIYLTTKRVISSCFSVNSNFVFVRHFISSDCFS